MANAEDLQFLQQAASLNAEDIADGLLAFQLSPSFLVSQLGHQELVDHSSLNAILQTIVVQEGLTEPAQLTSVFQSQVNASELQTGPNSDFAYLSKEITQHQQSLVVYTTEMQQGQDPLLRSYAQSTIPVLAGHLSQAGNLFAFGSVNGFVP